MTPLLLWRPEPARRSWLHLAVASLVIALLAIPAVAAAQSSSGGPYTLSRPTLSASGGAVSGGILSGWVSVGEPGAGPLATGGAYTMTTGFLAGIGTVIPGLSTISNLPQVFKRYEGGW